ncbi:ribosome silencing factor [Gammaproteobacteria bacterium]|nr:ribosome silencing factor [Gammaproteobacteria bacterium]
MKERELKEIILEAANDLKGQSINCIDVRRLTSIADYMVIVTGRSSTHVKALSDNVVKEVKKAKFEVVGVEGRAQSEWVLVDVGDIIVHVMLNQIRKLYNLEELWNFEVAPKLEKKSVRSPESR